MVFYFQTLFILLSLLISHHAEAACGASNRTYLGRNQNWSQSNTWSGNNIPDTSGENAIVQAGAQSLRVNGAYTVGCVEIQSGQMRSFGSNSVTVTGDYFKALTSNTLSIAAGDSSFAIRLNGTGAQDFSVLDPVNILRISGNNTVNLTHAFSIRNQLVLDGTSTTVNVQADLSINAGASAVTIPAGVTLEIENGAVLTSNVNITVNGTLVIREGSQLAMGNGTTLQVNSGGVVQLVGASGNIAKITSTGSGASFGFNMAGIMQANHFRIDRMGSAGLNITGTLQFMDNGEFHFIASAGYAITLGASASIPSLMNTVGFFDDSGFGNTASFNASAYTSSVVTIDNWSGSSAGPTKELDPNNKIDWDTQAGTLLTISNNTPAGNPSGTINFSSADTYFTTFAIALNQASAATSITQVVLTMTGTGSASDVQVVKLYKDAGAANCSYDAGVDTQLGSNLTLSGSPAKATLNLSAGVLTTSSDTDRACIHVVAATSSTAQDGLSLQFSVSGTADVSNSEGYEFSPAAGPPVSGSSTTIIGNPVSSWQGNASALWSNRNNWSNRTVPTSTTDCVVGAGASVARLDVVNGACQNATFPTGGSLNWNNTTNELAVYGTLDGQTSYTFSNAASANVAMRGASNQSLVLSTTFPGNLTIANTGVAPSNEVTLTGNTTITGNLTLTSGQLTIGSGRILTVGGNITVNSGATLKVGAGGTLRLANGRTLTVNSGGVLELVGSAGSTAVVTSTSTANAYNVVVHGTIKAQYYGFSNLGVNGVSIESGASIDATYRMQNCSFSYPVSSNSTLLKLKRQVPTNTLDNCSFSKGGSAASNVVSIDTTGAATGTLTLNSYSGDLAGPDYDIEGSYLLSWAGSTNTLNIDRGAAGPATATVGQTVNMGRFRFKQTLAGASYSDTNITSLKLTLTGTAGASAVSLARIYYDAACTGSGGVQIGSGTFSGSPASITFSIAGGSAPVQASSSSPPHRCIYVAYTIASGATPGQTLGAQITASTDVVNSMNYAASGSSSFPLTLGTPASIQASTSTAWTGSVSSNWFNAGNWTAGVPTSTIDCSIAATATSPVIDNSDTARCKSFVITTGTLTMQNGVGAVLEVFGNMSIAGTFNQNDGVLRVTDGGAGSAQTIYSAPTLNSLTFNKTSGGSVTLVTGNMTVNNFSMPAGSNFEFSISGSKTLNLPNGLNHVAGTFTIGQGGNIALGNGQSITVSGGTFRIVAVNDAYPQATTNKGKITVIGGGAGSWGFSATAGALAFTGFIFDRINTSGIVVGGSATLSAFNGGQFTNLSTSYNSVKALQLNNANIPATATNVGFNWGADHALPAETDSYKVVSSTDCGGKTISFDNWFGDFYYGDVDPDEKVSATNCNIVMGNSASPVTMDKMAATPYNQEVAISWHTISEWNNLGFNLYRSTARNGHYIKLNQLLIGGYGSPERGEKYYFIDKGLTNGTTYYYLIESVYAAGVTESYGPLTATPQSNLGSAPLTPPWIAPTPVENPEIPLQNGGVQDFGGGIKLVAQSQNTLRLVIEPDAPIYSLSSWNADYKRVDIQGYNAGLEAGRPLYLARTILIPVDENFGSAQVIEQSLTERAEASGVLEPIPEWRPISGTQSFEPYYILGPSYSGNAFTPAAYYSLQSDLEVVAGKKYVKLTVWPLRSKPVQNKIRSLSKLTIDIGLDGAGWQPVAPPADLAIHPSAVGGVLRMRLNKTAIYSLTYDDLVSLNLEGPFKGRSIDQLSMYYRGVEIPIEVLSANSIFDAGDEIRFFVHVQTDADADFDEVVLSPFRLSGSGVTLRVSELNGNPTGYPNSTAMATYARSINEKNNYFVYDYLLGVGVDHFFWQRMIHPFMPWNPTETPKRDFKVQLPNLVNHLGGEVTLRIQVAATASMTQGVDNHMGVWVNSVPYRLADKVFQGRHVQEIVVKLSTQYFASGENIIAIEAMSDLMPDGEYQILDVDKIIVEYPASYTGFEGKVEMWTPDLDRTIKIRGFASNQVSVYDLSDPYNVQKITQTLVTGDADNAYDVQFVIRSNCTSGCGYRVQAIEDGHYQKPQTLFVNRGYRQSLKSSSRAADLLVIGHRDLLAGVDELIARRKSQGLRVEAVTPDQIFAEFSHGRPSVHAIRDFIRYAKANWQTPSTKYVLIVGKSTYDPNDFMQYGTRGRALPVPLEKGFYEDFGSDNWFVANPANDTTPELAIGRIPFDHSHQVAAYVRKIIAYENGDKAPNQGLSHLQIFTDEERLNENFDKLGNQIGQEWSGGKVGASYSAMSRTALGGIAQTKLAIVDSFNNGPLALAMLGHGATDFWAHRNVMASSDALLLQNPRLPIVMGLGCLTGMFYEADPSFMSLGEALVANPEGGAIAYWGSPALTLPQAQAQLTQSFFKELSQETENTVQSQHQSKRLGDVILKSKVSLSANSSLADTLKSYTLLGDPSLVLPQGLFKADPVESVEPGQPQAPEGPTSPSAPAAENSSGGGGGCGIRLFASADQVSKGSVGTSLPVFLAPLMLLLWLRRRYL